MFILITAKTVKHLTKMRTIKQKLSMNLDLQDIVRSSIISNKLLLFNYKMNNYFVSL